MRLPRIALLAVLALAVCACTSSIERPRYISDIVREAQTAAERMTERDVAEIRATAAKLKKWRETANEEQQAKAAVGYALGINTGLLNGGTGMSSEDCAWLTVYSAWVDAGVCAPGEHCTYGATALVGPPPQIKPCSRPECAGRNAIAYQDWQQKVWRLTEIWNEKAGLCRAAMDGWWNFGAGGVPPLSAYDRELDALRDGGR